MKKAPGVQMLFVGFLGAMLAVVSIAFADSRVAKDVFEGLRASATMVAACVGVWVAHHGLQTWNRQLRGGARFDACRKFLEATFRMRDEFASMRAPFRRVFQKDGEAFKEASDRDHVTRYNRLVELLRECEVASYAVEVTVGGEVRDWLKSLSALVHEISLALESTIGGARNALLDANEAREILYETTIGKSGQFTADIKRAIDAIETSLGPIIRESV